mgnify:CR=1 FL=1
MNDARRAPTIAAFASLVAGASACATTRTAYDVPMSDPGLMAENWRLPEQIVEGYTGGTLDEAALVQKLAPARVIYVAERHDRPPDHAIQLFVLTSMYRLDPSVALGIEMLPRTKQKFIDAYLRGELDEAGFLAHVDWEETWGFDFALYRPLFEFAKFHGLPVVALNARKEITRSVARDGLDGLDDELARDVPELDLDHEEHRAYVREAFGLTDDGGDEVHPGFVFENFYEAQVIWDETMAETVAQTMTSSTAPKRMVVIAGSGHIEYRFGIPERAARRGAEPFRTVLPIVWDDLEDAPETLDRLVDESIADFLWLMSPRDRLPDPVPPRVTARR